MEFGPRSKATLGKYQSWSTPSRKSAIGRLHILHTFVSGIDWQAEETADE